MVEFKYEKEKEIFHSYAQLLGNGTVIKFIQSGQLKNVSEATIVAQFYWQMVDESVEDDTRGESEYEDMDLWLERIYTSLHIFFNNYGFESAWLAAMP